MASERQRRSTAGQRMQVLTGKALEDDEAFWGHDTWEQDENDSGNESFHSSDEDSEVRKDVFDSDFDESESDHEEEEVAAGDEEERDLQRQERNRKRANLKRSYLDISRAKPGKKGRGGAVKSAKRVVGHGLNAGIVLNLPPNADLTLPLRATVKTAPAAPKAASAVYTTSTAAHAPPIADVVSSASPRRHRASDSKLTLATTRARRVTQLSKYSSRYRSARKDATVDSEKPTTTSPSISQKKQKRQRFTQEELLLEAANQTEPENVRWLLGRKRIQTQSSQKDHESREGRGSAGKVIEKYISRRGYLNTVTFPEMDHVPSILTKQDSSNSTSTPVAPTLCVITGHRAKYRDPRTGMGYYDAVAFRELRRRLAEGEPLDQRTPKDPPSQSQDKQEKELDPLSSAAAVGNNLNPASKKDPKFLDTTTETSVASTADESAASPTLSNGGGAAKTNGRSKVEAARMSNQPPNTPPGSPARAIEK